MEKITFLKHQYLDELLTRIKFSPEEFMEIEEEEGGILEQSPIHRQVVETLVQEWNKKISWSRLPSSETSSPQQEEPVSKAPEDITKVTRVEIGQETKLSPRRRLPFSPWFLGLAFLSLILFFGGVFSFLYFYLPKATITLFVQERTLEKEEEIVVDPDKSEVDGEERVVPGKRITVEAEETAEFQATGKEKTGEKAKGTITVQNWTNNKKTFPEGSKVVVEEGQEGAGLVFLLNEAVVVPAQTLTVPELGQRLIEAGTANVSITAAEIGETYNLSTETKFNIGGEDYSSLSCFNSESFSGGLTREITVVTAENQSEAREQLVAKLASTAKEDLKAKLLDNQVLLEQAIKQEVLAANYSCEAGEEADKFNLHLKTKSIGIVFNASELNFLMVTLLKESVPENYVLSSDEHHLSYEMISQEEDKIKLLVRLKGLVVPQYNEEELVNLLAGKRPSQAEKILKELPKLEGYRINLWPQVPRMLQVLPYRKERLTIEVVAR